MLDVRAQSSTSEVEIARISLKKSGEEGNGVLVDLDLAEVIETEDEAALVDQLVPGARQLWSGSKNAQAAKAVDTELEGAAAGAQAASASAGPFGTYTIPMGDDGLRFVIGEHEHVIDCAIAEVVSYRVKSTPSVCVCTVKARLEGLTRDQIALLVGMLGEQMKVTSERRQGALPFRRRTPGTVGEIVSGIHAGVEYAGVIVGRSKDEDGAEMVEVDDCGEVFLVPATTISGSFPSGDEAIRNQRVGEFVNGCKAAKKKPTWKHLVTELGAAYLQAPPPNGQWTLTDDIVAKAIAAAKTKKPAA